jgi:hypothetical protein
MRRTRRPSASLLVLLFAASTGCAPLTAQRCAQADAYAAGVADGRAGRPADDACGAGTADDAARYAAGRAAGLREYCTIENGVRAGRSGAAYRDVCADAGEQAFLSGYYLGALSPRP